MLVAHGLSKVKNNTLLLKDVDISVVSGMVTGVLSLDRTETTTLLELLAGHDFADAGSIFLDDRPLEFTKNGWARFGIQAIPGSGRLFNNLSIADNMLVGISKRRRVVHLDRLIKRVKPIVQEFGLRYSLDTLVSKLSIAERQSLSLSLLFLQEEDYLLVRDCFANLSLEQYQKFREKLVEIKRQGKGILVVPETPGQIFELCDQVVLLRAGKVIYSGEVSQIDIEEAYNILNNSPYMIRQAVENKFNQFHNSIMRLEIFFERSLKVISNFCGLPNAFIVFHDEEGKINVQFSKYWNKETKYGLEKGVKKILEALPVEKRLGALNLGSDKYLWYVLSAEANGLVVLAVEAADHPEFPFREVRKEMTGALSAIRAKVLQAKAAREMELSALRLVQEMDIARNIQKSILPRRPELPGYKVATHMETATEVGGDSYDIIQTSLGNFISIGDVSGHGLPSGIMALIEMSALHGIVQSQIVLGGPPEPDKIYDMINRVLCEINRDRIGSDKFMTKMLLIEKNGKFVHAGTHEIGLFYSQKTQRITELSEMIDRTGFLGISELVNSVGSLGSFDMNPGDFLFLYTDGLIEAKNEHSEQFGIDRVKDLLLKNQNRIPEDLLGLVRNEVFAWAKRGDVQLHGGRLADDLTMLLIQQEAS